MEYRKCFVPSCGNDSINQPNKIIVRIREDLREEWCRKVNVEYFKVYTMYCCEDHFEPMEDLVNYFKVITMKDEPRLKRTAKLRNVNVFDERPCELLSKNSELQKLLLQPLKPEFCEVNLSVCVSRLNSPNFKVPNNTYPKYLAKFILCKVIADAGCLHISKCDADFFTLTSTDADFI